ncbi:hypothetical protein O6H91_03G066700 [Diphasiastrum complanatum]|uniref:Uncharacterized protein n=1 Tax=Diphasiastrum complanatum TaxID=34168 RepID=A0ACC2E7E6_DIPCM|nr:hypothetical protein O6H91_03G066700 [Diphasiastrum complanatum]
MSFSSRSMRAAVRNDFVMHLERIEEDTPIHSPAAHQKILLPETPQPLMEFLSRKWNGSAFDVTAALASSQAKEARKPFRHTPDTEGLTLEKTHFEFASASISKVVMDHILTPRTAILTNSKRKSHRNSSLMCHFSGPLTSSPPPSPRLQEDELQYCRAVPSTKEPFMQGKWRTWIKNMKDRCTVITSSQSAQVHSAVSVAGVAAGIAGIAIKTSTLSTNDGDNEINVALASAASLVATHFMDVAENIGANHEQVQSAVHSATNVKTTAEMMNLIASAATATSRVRTMKGSQRSAVVAPSQRERSHPNSFSSNMVCEDSEAEDYYTRELLAKGHEFLKRTKTGKPQWRLVIIFLDKRGQVVLKLQSNNMGGPLIMKKTKKSIIIDMNPHIPSWPERRTIDNRAAQRRYFGLKTTRGFVEFECESVYLHNLWTQGISNLLSKTCH